MQHVADGILRRLRDEPQAVSSANRRHVADCDRCRVRMAAIVADAEFTAKLLAAPVVASDTAGALRRLQQRITEDAMSRPFSLQERFAHMINQRKVRLAKPLGGIAAGVSLAAAIVLTPAGAWAGNFLSVFEPTQVTAVPIDLKDLHSLPDLSKYGTIHAPAEAANQHFTVGADAAKATGLPLLTPKSLPAGVPNTPTYEVMPAATGSFTFSAAKAQANAAAQGKTLPAMPANLDGATLQVSTGAALVEVYADPSKLQTASARGKGDAGSAANPNQAAMAAAQGVGPALVIAEMNAPSVTTTGNGVTVAQLESYLLAQPGISPSLAAAIKGIGDPSSTLPIPIPISKAVSQNVTLTDGTHAVLVGDSTGLVGGIIWEKNHVVYGVGGSLTKDQLLSLANGIVS
ncbi:MAG: hypothetical protein ACR2JY_00395 [Chloroflexota bacterium]